MLAVVAGKWTGEIWRVCLHIALCPTVPRSSWQRIAASGQAGDAFARALVGFGDSFVSMSVVSMSPGIGTWLGMAWSSATTVVRPYYT